MNIRKLITTQNKIEYNQNLKNKHILLTGRIKQYTRVSIEKMIINAGGIIEDKATLNVTTIVYNRTDTKKYNDSLKLKDEYTTYNPVFVTSKDFIDNYLKLKPLKG